jgi:hypothetical protein
MDVNAINSGAILSINAMIIYKTKAIKRQSIFFIIKILASLSLVRI